MGQRCSDTRGITFEDVRVPARNVLGAGQRLLDCNGSIRSARARLWLPVPSAWLGRALDEAVRVRVDRERGSTSRYDRRRGRSGRLWWTAKSS